jgi:hypothetical protein
VSYEGGLDGSNIKDPVHMLTSLVRLSLVSLDLVDVYTLRGHGPRLRERDQHEGLSRNRSDGNMGPVCS